MRFPAALRRRGHKYNARKTTVDGIMFDSRKEAERYLSLKAMERTGFIRGLVLQPEFELQPGFRHPDQGAIRAVKYRADFQYEREGRTVVEDVKGMKTKEYLIKRKLFLSRYPDILFREV